MINYDLKKCINSDFAITNDVPNNTKITIIQKIGHTFRQRKNREYWNHFVQTWEKISIPCFSIKTQLADGKNMILK